MYKLFSQPFHQKFLLIYRHFFIETDNFDPITVICSVNINIFYNNYSGTRQYYFMIVSFNYSLLKYIFCNNFTVFLIYLSYINYCKLYIFFSSRSINDLISCSLGNSILYLDTKIVLSIPAVVYFTNASFFSVQSSIPIGGFSPTTISFSLK